MQLQKLYPIFVQEITTFMEELQQTVFHNLTKQTKYYSSSKKLTDKHDCFPKFREQQILNEFELVDIHNNGKLNQKQIISYLSDKYQWLNISVVKEVFRTMTWTEDQYVTKEQFVRKYLAKERQLYNQINGLKHYEKWVRTLEQIYNTETSRRKPRVYFYTQIRSIELYENMKLLQWMDIKIDYQSHQTKNYYEIQQSSHSANFPSFQIWLPADKDAFFLRFSFLQCGSQDKIYGHTYLNIPLSDKMNKIFNFDLQITKNGKKVGHCAVYACAEPSMEKVKQQLRQIKEKENFYKDLNESKVKQYEYLQFLWGIRHRSPHKISPLDVKWMIGVRIFLIIILGILGLLIHIFGRFQPLSLVIMFLFLQIYEYVLMRHEKFLLTCLAACGILLDVIWLALSSSGQNQINFIPISSAVFLTYALLGTKFFLLGYLLLIEKSLDSN